MIASFHKWTKFPIELGEPLCYSFEVSGQLNIRRAKKNDDHNCFAAEKITGNTVSIDKVKSPLGIYLASNFTVINGLDHLEGEEVTILDNE